MQGIADTTAPILTGEGRAASEAQAAAKTGPEFDSRGRRLRYALYANGGEPLVVGKDRRKAKEERARKKAEKRKILGALHRRDGKRFDVGAFKAAVVAAAEKQKKEQKESK